MIRDSIIFAHSLVHTLYKVYFDQIAACAYWLESPDHKTSTGVCLILLELSSPKHARKPFTFCATFLAVPSSESPETYRHHHHSLERTTNYNTTDIITASYCRCCTQFSPKQSNPLKHQPGHQATNTLREYTRRENCIYYHDYVYANTQTGIYTYIRASFCSSRETITRICIT